MVGVVPAEVLGGHVAGVVAAAHGWGGGGGVAGAMGQGEEERPNGRAGAGTGQDAPAAEPAPMPEEPAVVTEHRVEVGGRELRYAATVGALPIKGERGDQSETEARIFFAAYTLQGEQGEPLPAGSRPLTFAFNGGPGSSSAWLHLGGLGPRRVAMLADGAMPPPPFRVEANPHTWLGATDLVFVDPVGTGWSRARTPELDKKFQEVGGDIAAVGEFVRLYLSRYGRWGSPLFLAGESYGTFRAAGLAGSLIERGIAFNGIILISIILDYLGADFHPGNDLPYPLILPTYAAIAWYHGKLEPELQGRGLDDVLAEVEGWALGGYLAALAAGTGLGAGERAEAAARLARYTGLGRHYVEQSNLRVEIGRFCRELLRERGVSVGRLDGRYTRFEGEGTGEAPGFDPSLGAIRPPFTAALNAYLRGELGWETDEEYHVLRGLEWGWGSAEGGYPRTAPALAEAFAKNPYLRVFVASGRYDLATPYFATDYTLAHLPLSAAARAGVRVEKYPVGHMVYIEEGSLAKLAADVAGFIAGAVGQAGVGLGYGRPVAEHVGQSVADTGRG